MPRSLHSLLRYWHLLSLDAPTVAGLWCWAFGRAARQRLAPWLPLALALGTWLFYVADRLLDARRAPTAELQERHHFHHRHRSLFLVAAVPVAAALLVLIARMPRSLLTEYAWLSALSLVYLIIVHWPVAREDTEPRPYTVLSFSKELVVGLLFATATALPAWDEAQRRADGMPRHHPLLLLCPLFAALCWLNCIAIDRWEHTPVGPGWRVPLRTMVLLVAASAAFSLLELQSAGARGLAVSTLCSALLFLVIDRSRLGAGARRIAADLILLTPLLMLTPFLMLVLTRLWSTR